MDPCAVFATITVGVLHLLRQTVAHGDIRASRWVTRNPVIRLFSISIPRHARQKKQT